MRREYQDAIPGLGVSLADREAAAIEALRHYEPAALALDPRGYYLADSYGKDSCVILDLAKRSGVAFEAHHHLTTIDPPELVQWGRRAHPETIVDRPAVPLLKRMAESKSNGPPTRIARWCCAEYKEGHGENRIKILGIRGAESPRRAKAWGVFTRSRRPGDAGAMLCPIIDWSDADLWAYLRRHDVPYSPLYDEGWTRLGCVGCPMAGPRTQRREFDRWPRMETAWQRAFARYWERWHGVPKVRGGERWIDKPERGWTSWRDLWDWWVTGKADKADDDCADGHGCQMGLW